MSDIFISYSREDLKKVEALICMFKSEGWSIWWDQKIPGGRQFDTVIEEEIEKAKCVIVVWSAHSVKKRWVKSEAEEGARREILIPVVIEKTTIPLAFRQIQTIKIVDWDGAKNHPGLKQLIHDIHHLLSVPPTDTNAHKGTASKLPSGIQLPSSDEIDTREMVLIPQVPFLYSERQETREIPYDFFIDKYPVTNEQFSEFLSNDGYKKQAFWSPEGWGWKERYSMNRPLLFHDPKFNASLLPVVGVNYYEAEAFAKWQGKRLPNEMEWEIAARGIDGRHWPWGMEFDKKKCNSIEAGFNGTSPVNQYPEGASPYGCIDMAGNVWEWASTWDEDDIPVTRGGSWLNQPSNLRVFCRCVDYPPTFRHHNIGFRCIRRT